MPFATTSSLDSAGQAVTSFEREDVATMLTLTPHINGEHAVTLELSIEVSEVEESALSTETAESGGGYITSACPSSSARGRAVELAFPGPGSTRRRRPRCRPWRDRPAQPGSSDRMLSAIGTLDRMGAGAPRRPRDDVLGAWLVDLTCALDAEL